jgi:hypothetical protein
MFLKDIQFQIDIDIDISLKYDNTSCVQLIDFNDNGMRFNSPAPMKQLSNYLASTPRCQLHRWVASWFGI